MPASRPSTASLPAARPGPLFPSSPEAVRDFLSQVLAAAGLEYDQRMELLGGLFVAEAVRPYWESGHAADDAHELLRLHDAELADAVEALSPILLGRAEAHEEAHLAVLEVDALLFGGG